MPTEEDDEEYIDGEADPVDMDAITGDEELEAGGIEGDVEDMLGLFYKNNLLILHNRR